MRILIPTVLIPLAIVLVFIPVPGIRERPWTLLRISGAILAAVAYGLVITARIELGRSFSFRPEAKGLVRHGLYARIRNPMYIFLDLTVFGLALALHFYWLLAFVAVVAIFQVRQARREARVLLEEFGQAYVDYRKQTWIGILVNSIAKCVRF